MIELISSVFTYFGLILASDTWRFATSDRIDPAQVRTFKMLAVFLAFLVTMAQSWWLARRRPALLRIVIPPALSAGLAVLTSVWLVTRRGGRCDDCNLIAIVLIPPVLAAAAAALVALLTASVVRAHRGVAP